MAPPRTSRGSKNARGGAGVGAGKRGGRGGGGRDRSTYSAGGSAGGGFSEIPKSAVDQDSASEDGDGLGESLLRAREQGAKFTDLEIEVICKQMRMGMSSHGEYQ